MDRISLAVQACIGLFFAVYGVYSLYPKQERQNGQGKEKLVLSPVCILVGICLLGYVGYQVV
ncbi:MAG: hypothetical protein HFF86_02370 [Oscillibacter sp.]|nr:hypothetical protein [Oscillibacter sp.]